MPLHISVYCKDEDCHSVRLLYVSVCIAKRKTVIWLGCIVALSVSDLDEQSRFCEEHAGEWIKKKM